MGHYGVLQCFLCKYYAPRSGFLIYNSAFDSFIYGDGERETEIETYLEREKYTMVPSIGPLPLSAKADRSQ